MRIGFVGCGAIASCYAQYLIQKHEVCVLDVSEPTIENITADMGNCTGNWNSTFWRTARTAAASHLRIRLRGGHCHTERGTSDQLRDC